MAEPLPSQSQSTAQPDADDLPPAITNAEDRKAAAALSSLDARGDDDEYDNGRPGGGKGVNNNIDQEALGRAISRLEISAGGGGGGGGKAGGGKATEGKDGGDKSGNKGKGKESEALKKVKVDQNDVALLVSLPFFLFYFFCLPSETEEGLYIYVYKKYSTSDSADEKPGFLIILPKTGCRVGIK